MYASNKLNKVKALATGRWSTVFARYPGLVDAINRYPHQVPCPKTGGGTRKFRLTSEWERYGVCYHSDQERPRMDGLEVVSFMEGHCGIAKAMSIVLGILGGALKDIVPKITTVHASSKAASLISKEVANCRSDNINILLKNSQMACNHPLAHDYLRSLGLKGDFTQLPESLRFCESVGSTDEGVALGEKGVSASCEQQHCFMPMVHDVRGNQLTLNQIYFNHEKPSKLHRITKAERLLPPPASIGGAAMRIDAHPLVLRLTDGSYSAVLGLTESCEAGLAVREGSGIPVWACSSDSMLANISVESILTSAKQAIFNQFGDDQPRLSLDLMIFEDKDISGEGKHSVPRLLERCAKYKSINAVRCLPQGNIQTGKKSQSWLDEYKQSGPAAFPLHLEPKYRVPGAL